LEDIVIKIEKLMALSELMHPELQNLFREIKDGTENPLIEKSSVTFLKPYLVFG